MTVKDLSIIPSNALDLEMLKQHLRLGTGFSTSNVEDPVLEAYARAAVTAIEGRIDQALIERDFALISEDWNRFQSSVLLQPITRVKSVEITRPDGQRISQDAVFTPSAQGRLILLSGTLTPLNQGDAAIVTVSAGIASSVESLPPDLRHGVILLAAHYYEHRLDMGLDGRCMPLGVSALLETYRPIRLGASV